MNFDDLGRAFFDAIYESRIPIGIGSVVAAVGLLLVARRLRWFDAARRRPIRAGALLVVVLPDGTYEVVLENFSIGAIAHTNVVLVSNASVAKTDDIDKTKLLDLGPLQGTEGMQTYVVPTAMAATVMGGYHSVVIWDTQMTHAVAAASLQ